MQFGMLGPLTVQDSDRLLEISSGKQRVLLAALLIDANRVVDLDHLAQLMWSPFPPRTARVTVQNYMKRLRQTLGPVLRDRLVTHASGYLIRATDNEIDFARFQKLCAAGERAFSSGAWEEASLLLSDALSLWRGRPFCDVPSEALVRGYGTRLEELRLLAMEAQIAADIHLGRLRRVTVELRHLINANPLREALYALLMIALYQSGEQAAALAVYTQARAVLIDEVGIEPGPRLREIHRRILRSDAPLMTQASQFIAL